MTDFHFLRQYWLLSCIPVVVIWLRYRKQMSHESPFKKIIDPHLLEHLLVDQTEKKRGIPLNVLFVLLILSIIALCGPTFRQEASPFAGDDAGLMVLMKLSKSMSSKDLQPSRLERAKQKLRDLLELRSGKSTGLIVYSGSSHLVMPLTNDAQVITSMIEDLTPELMPREGDELTGAIKLGEKMINQSGQPGSILVMADSVRVDHLSELEKINTSIPFQFYSFKPIGSNVDSGLLQASKYFNTHPVEVSLDETDVESVSQRAQTSITQIRDREKGERWCDDGYWLVALIASCFLLWFRKGWGVR